MIGFRTGLKMCPSLMGAVFMLVVVALSSSWVGFAYANDEDVVEKLAVARLQAQEVSTYTADLTVAFPEDATVVQICDLKKIVEEAGDGYEVCEYPYYEYLGDEYVTTSTSADYYWNEISVADRDDALIFATKPGSYTFYIAADGWYDGMDSDWNSIVEHYIVVNVTVTSSSKGEQTITAEDSYVVEYSNKDGVALNATSSDTTATLMYESADTSIATVDDSGTVKPVKVGTTTVTISAAATAASEAATKDVQVTVGGTQTSGPTVFPNDEVQQGGVDPTIIYDGQSHVAIAAGEDYVISEYPGASYAKPTITDEGALATEPGNYAVLVAPAEGYEWAGRTRANVSPRAYRFKIDPAGITVTAQTSYTVALNGGTLELSATAEPADLGQYLAYSPADEASAEVFDVSTAGVVTPKKVGTGTVKISSGDDHYVVTGDSTITVTITAKDISKATVAFTDDVDEFEYTGTTINPDKVKVTEGQDELVAGTDYELVYPENSKDVGAYELIIVGKGAYDPATSTKIFYDIVAKPVTVSGIVAKDKVDDGTVDAELDCSNAVIEGLVSSDEVYVTATGSFEDAAVGTDKKVTISKIELTGKDAGNYVLADTGQQLEATASIEMSAEEADLANASIELDASRMTYSGKAQEPTVTVTTKGGKVLEKGIDYDVSYQSNINAGTAKAIATGKGSYSGTMTANFIIEKASQTISAKNVSKKLKANKKSKKLSKKRVLNLGKLSKANAETAVKFEKANKAGGAKIKVAKSGKVTVKKGLKAGTYKVKVKLTAPASENYEAAKAKTIKLNVKVK